MLEKLLPIKTLLTLKIESKVKVHSNSLKFKCLQHCDEVDPKHTSRVQVVDIVRYLDTIANDTDVAESGESRKNPLGF